MPLSDALWSQRPRAQVDCWDLPPLVGSSLLVAPPGVGGLRRVPTPPSASRAFRPSCALMHLDAAVHLAARQRLLWSWQQAAQLRDPALGRVLARQQHCGALVDLAYWPAPLFRQTTSTSLSAACYNLAEHIMLLCQWWQSQRFVKFFFFFFSLKKWNGEFHYR